MYVCVYMYIYICICVYVYIYIYTYIYIYITYVITCCMSSNLGKGSRLSGFELLRTHFEVELSYDSRI